MNIFVLDTDPKIAAKYHCDRHMKMITESAQMLSTAHYIVGIKPDVDISKIYKQTHVNHPCSKWVRESISNYNWVIELALAIGNENEARYHKIHASLAVINYLAENKPELPNIGLTEFALCMPDQFKINNDPVLSYRNFYIKDKSRFAKWKLGNIPDWYKI